MKKLLLTLALALGFIPLVPAQSSLFEEANAAYTSSEFERAIQLYDSILTQGYESSELYYNLGNAHYKMGETGSAILNYERAARLNLGDEDLANNLKLVQQTVIDKFEVVPQPIFKTAYLGLVKWLSPDSWGYLSLLFFIILAFGTYLYLFSSNRRPGFITASLGLILGLVSLSLAYAHQSHLDTNNPAIIMATSSYVKSAPSETAEDAFILHEGTKVLVVDELEQWSKIKLIDGKIGWIESEDISKV